MERKAENLDIGQRIGKCNDAKGNDEPDEEHDEHIHIFLTEVGIRLAFINLSHKNPPL